jgi:LPPG:FO 2-phospho-L-lactate transferase
MLKSLGYPSWFKLGDKDLATHIYRTDMIKKGFSLSNVTKKISSILKLKVKIIPVTNEKLQTMIMTNKGVMHFQEYYVKRKALDNVKGVYFLGIKDAEPSPGVLNSILNSKGIILCPSNPIVSINPILSVKGVKDALMHSKAKKTAISPIVGGAPIKGPAGKLMKGLGLEVSSFSVANIYKDFIDTFIIDNIDEKEANRIQNILKLKVKVTNTIMKNFQDKINLAKYVLNEIYTS